jgi:hypothetical protein
MSKQKPYKRRELMKKKKSIFKKLLRFIKKAASGGSRQIIGIPPEKQRKHLKATGE